MRIHDVCHVSLLKQYHSNGRAPAPPPAEVKPEWEVERTLSLQVVHHGHKTKVVYLMTFLGHGPEHTLWQYAVEDCSQLLEDI